MKFWKTLILIFIINTSIVFGEIKTTDKIVALVNHHIILDSDVRNSMYMILDNISNVDNNALQHVVYYQQILDQLITDKLIFQAATQQEITNNYTQLNQVICRISNLYDMTLDQFRAYLYNTGLNYEKYCTQQYQDMLKINICDRVTYHRASILTNEINKVVNKLEMIDFNKQFKLRHITFSLPIQPTQNQINTIECFARLLIKKKEFNKNNSIKKLIRLYSNKYILQIIKVQETEWVSWKDMPIIFDQHLKKIEKGDLIGPILSHDGIHIAEVQDIRYKQLMLPITKIKAKIFGVKDSCNNVNIVKQLLQIKELIEKNNTTFDIITKEKLKSMCFDNYEENIIYKDLDDFEPSIRRALITLKNNEISMPMHIYDGWYLVQLMDFSILDYTAIIHERAYLYLLSKKFNEIMKYWIQELRSSSYIKILN
ncbi:SurA N-terminal domain-containing protein [Blochmannia endosymbiont of Camponotus sp.]|uniref:SurA N-terminal domain-containing protein n=1 Tax=Blochmannia endosymbiont of Camponotus sp. TaxID=700220 RepID=UPI002024A37A|nr:SurA N-terminal domain-containing protein [Blochmannia endosymbiont of Camponotus sp.]URJ30231.1 SurA N-terminal domain-containing protein [Blochmannia endosymbiont of Camponotus sp.]